MSLNTYCLLTPSLLALSLATPRVLCSQDRDTVKLQPIVVTATRVSIPVVAVASAVTVVTGGELRARGLRTMAEALRTVPGVAVVETGSPGGQTSLFLRGGESDYVKILLDGVALNLPGGSLDLADLTLDNVDRIEVVRGPASVLYGSDAVTGVIQIFTRAGMGAPRLEVLARAGRYGTTDVSAEARGGGARAAWTLGVSRIASSGLYAYNNDYRNAVVTGRLRVAPDAWTSAALVYRLGNDVYHFPTNGAGEPVDSNQVSAERGPVLSATVTRAFGSTLDAHLVATLRELRQRFRDEPDSPGEDGRFESRDLVRRATAGVLVNWRARPGTVLTGGIEYADDAQRGRSVFEASFGSFPDSIDVARWNRAAYAQALVEVGGGLSTQLGLRLDHNARFGAYMTYRAGVAYGLDGNTRIRATVGTGFKEPTFFENFARGFVRGNPDLDPERSTSWEAGLEHTVGAVTFAVTYFDQRFRDLIEFTFTPAPPDSVNYFNVAGATVNGAEATIDASLPGGMSLAIRYSYLDARVLEPGLDATPDAAFAPGGALLRRPAHSLAVLARTPVRARGRATVETRLVGAREDLDFTRPAGDRRVTLRAYARVDVGAEYPVGAHFDLLGRVENLFDDDARDIANFPSRRRSLCFGGRLTIGN